MRKVKILTFVSLDGVMQAPGGPDEDRDDGFSWGGWSVPYWDDALARVMDEQMSEPFDLLLGRRTYDVFAGAWPTLDPASPINSAMKAVVTSRPLPPETAVWKNSIALTGDPAAAVRALKNQDGPDLQVHGSASLVRLLLAEGLADELWLKTYPVILGRGKRLFDPAAAPLAWTLIRSEVTPQGVVTACYRKAGPLVTGSFA